MKGSQGMHSPVAQFEIKPLIEMSFGGQDLSFTNSSLFMMLAIGVRGIPDQRYAPWRACPGPDARPC